MAWENHIVAVRSAENSMWWFRLRIDISFTFIFYLYCAAANCRWRLSVHELVDWQSWLERLGTEQHQQPLRADGRRQELHVDWQRLCTATRIRLPTRHVGVCWSLYTEQGCCSRGPPPPTKFHTVFHKKGTTLFLTIRALVLLTMSLAFLFDF